MVKSAKIYLSGPISGSSNPDRWREDIKTANATDSIEFLDPRDVKEEEVDNEVQEYIRMMVESDGIIVHYERNTESWQPAIEAFIAQSKDKPVVVWTGRYQGPKDELDPFLRYSADAIHKNGRDALNKMLKLI